MRWRNTLSKSDSAAWQIPAIGQCWATLTHLEMPGTFTAMGTRGTQPRAWGTSLLWLLAKTNCNPTRVFSCKASATLVDGMRFKPHEVLATCWLGAVKQQPSADHTCLVLPANATHLVCRSWVWWVPLVEQTMLTGRARAVRTKGWFCSAEVFESWDSSLCPYVHPVLPWGGWEVFLLGSGWHGGDNGPLAYAFQVNSF